jgi:bacteriorhodopsin
LLLYLVVFGVPAGAAMIAFELGANPQTFGLLGLFVMALLALLLFRTAKGTGTSARLAQKIKAFLLPKARAKDPKDKGL